MSTTTDTITKVYLRSDVDYLPRVRRIAECLAAEVGMDTDEAGDTALLLNEACVNAIKHGSPRGDVDNVVITIHAVDGQITADVRDCGGTKHCDGDTLDKGLGVRLMRMLADSLQFILDRTGLTVRFTKRARSGRKVCRLRVKAPANVHRN